MCGVDDVDAPHPSILESCTQSFVQASDRFVGGDHRRQIRRIAVIHDLEELFLCPLGTALCSQIVQDQQL